MSRHPTVEVISRIALDAAAPLDLTAGAISLAVMTVGVVVLAHCAPDVARQLTHDVNEPEPSAANHFIRLTLIHPVASEADR